MGNFTGGSPLVMVRDIGEGYVTLSAPVLKKFSLPELDRLRQEVEKLIREMRSSPPPQDQPQDIQFQQRKILRLSGAFRMIQHRMAELQRSRI
jgi:hypothetical protein